MNISDIEEMMREECMTDECLLRVFDYYQIQNDGRSKLICCFHPDKKYGNASFGKYPGKFRCFKCAKTYSTIDIVEHMEPQLDTYYKKLSFLYGTIMGLPIPSCEKEEHFLTNEQLTSIGIYHGRGGYIKYPVGTVFRQEKTKFDKGPADEDGYCVVYKKQRVPSLYEIYKKDPGPILDMLNAKSVEMINDLSRRISASFYKKTEEGRICAEYPDIAKDYRQRLRHEREAAEETRKLILKLKKKLSSKAS